MEHGVSSRHTGGFAWLVAVVLILPSHPAGANVTWLPSTYPAPTLIADPYEPRMAIAYFPAKFKLRVLDPVHFDVPPDQERYSRSRVMDESERIRQTVQEALYDMLRARRSVWFG